MASRVLLADNSATVQKTVSVMLADEGIEVVAVSDGEQARQLLDSTSVDLVITSLSLPAASGYELCRYIKSSRHLRNVPVILLVGAFEQLDQMDALRVGADAQLSKPPESRPLIQTVRNLIEKNGRANRPSLMPVMHLEDATGGDGQIEELKPQSVFFKPYMPPPNLTADSLALEVRALPARVQSNKLDRKPERVPEGASVIIMTVLAILAVVGLVLWLVTRSNDTVSDGMPVAQQTTTDPTLGETLTSRNGAAAADSSVDNNGAAREPNVADVSKEAAEQERGNDAHSTTQLERADQDWHQSSIAPSRIERNRRGQQNSRSEQNTRASFTPVAPSLAREQMLARARAYEDRGMLAQAELHYRAVLHNFPGDETSRFAINRVQERVAAQRSQESARASRDAGLRAFRSGDYSSAVTSLTAAQNAGRGDTVVLYSLGMSQWKLGRNREAQAAFERCLVTNPNYAPAMVGLAQVKAAEGKRSDAIALLHRALQLGGGAEFSPERIREMISRYQPRSSRP
jgi:DNA-binding response OmpR family regulator